MPWREVSKVESRMLFVKAVESGRWSFSEVCRRFGITRRTGYKWMKRYLSEGPEGLYDRSRRPARIVHATDPLVADRLVELRGKRPYWGVRKLCRLLERAGLKPPPERTANRILKRAGLVEQREGAQPASGSFQRREANQLWQMDHKSAIHGKWGTRCVPFAVLDDHSRYLLELKALGDKGLNSTWGALWETLGRWGLPDAVLSDNDSVFHGGNGPSQLEVRLMRLGIEVLHGRPYHPETQGKVERLNGTLEHELLKDGYFESAQEVQGAFDGFRRRYNFERPHESLDMDVPAQYYHPSARRRPDRLAEMEYASGAVTRKVDKDGWVHWKGKTVNVGRGLYRERVEVRQSERQIEIYYGPYRITAQELGRKFVGVRQRRRLGGGNSASGYALSFVSTTSKCIPCGGTSCTPCRDT